MGLIMKFYTSLLWAVLLTFPFSQPECYESYGDMIEQTLQFRIRDTTSIPNGNTMVTMTDGSVWQFSFDPTWREEVGRYVQVEADMTPLEPGRVYTWVYGQYIYDGWHWKEFRKYPVLVRLGSAAEVPVLPESEYLGEHALIDVSITGYGELLTLDNETVIVVPKQHGGFAADERVQIQLMPSGQSGYLVRHLPLDGREVLIPLTRQSDGVFVGY